MVLADEIRNFTERSAEGIARYVLTTETVAAYVVPFLALALAAWWLQRRRGDARGFFAYLLPRSVYLHRSTWVDLQVLVANRLVLPVVGLLGAAATAGVAWLVAAMLQRGLPEARGLLPGDSFLVAGSFTLALALCYDFATWVAHWLHHRVPRLWAFHKLHHSAEVLSPLTAFRHHPVWELHSELLDALMVGPFLGAAFYLMGGPVDALTLFGVHVVFVGFQLLGAGLRHSHMWLSYGPWLSRVVVSPAMHQIHHSADPRHHDRNFGEVFAVWDWLFGTLYVPTEHEALTFGVDEPHGHTNLWRAWWLPFREAFAPSRQVAQAP